MSKPSGIAAFARMAEGEELWIGADAMPDGTWLGTGEIPGTRDAMAALGYQIVSIGEFVRRTRHESSLELLESAHG